MPDLFLAEEGAGPTLPWRNHQSHRFTGKLPLPLQNMEQSIASMSSNPRGCAGPWASTCPRGKTAVRGGQNSKSHKASLLPHESAWISEEHSALIWRVKCTRGCRRGKEGLYKHLLWGSAPFVWVSQKQALRQAPSEAPWEATSESPDRSGKVSQKGKKARKYGNELSPWASRVLGPGSMPSSCQSLVRTIPRSINYLELMTHHLQKILVALKAHQWRSASDGSWTAFMKRM